MKWYLRDSLQIYGWCAVVCQSHPSLRLSVCLSFSLHIKLFFITLFHFKANSAAWHQQGSNYNQDLWRQSWKKHGNHLSVCHAFTKKQKGSIFFCNCFYIYWCYWTRSAKNAWSDLIWLLRFLSFSSRPFLFLLLSSPCTGIEFLLWKLNSFKLLKAN